MVKVSGLPNCQLSLMLPQLTISHFKCMTSVCCCERLFILSDVCPNWWTSESFPRPWTQQSIAQASRWIWKKAGKENTAEMPWQHTLKADLHSHGPFNVTSNERYSSAERKRWVYLQVQPCWDVETYGAGEKEIRRTLMWLSKVHWTTCDNSLSSCIYSFNVCSSLGDNCLNWYSKCYCFCVRREINSCGVPLCMSRCLISQCILIFNSLRLGFLLSFNLSAS